jgi:hypothetical protein
MVALVQSENAIGDTTVSAVTSGAMVGDWSSIDPWSIIGVAIAGVVLLLLGARILRPAMVLAASMLGAILGLQLAGATREGSLPAVIQAMGIPPLVWVVGLPLTFGLATLAIARLALAVLLGAAVGTAVLLIGLAIATQGRVIDGAAGTGVSVASVRVVQEEGGEANDVTTQAIGEAVTRMLEDGASAESSGWIPELPEASAVVPQGLAAWWRNTTAGVPEGTVELVVALATVTGLCAGLLGLMLPTRTAAIATSVCGGWLLSGTVVTAWVRWMPEASPPTPFMTLLAWAVLTGLGVMFQWNSARRSGED